MLDGVVFGEEVALGDGTVQIVEKVVFRIEDDSNSIPRVGDILICGVTDSETVRVVLGGTLFGDTAKTELFVGVWVRETVRVSEHDIVGDKDSDIVTLSEIVWVTDP